MSSVYEYPINQNDGKSSSLKAAGEGKVILVVNVASKCGLTPQYTALESVYNKYKDQGLVVAGFPSNDFLGQEPGSDAEILDFCQTKFNVTFPLFQKIAVKGPTQHPLYSYLTTQSSSPRVSNGPEFENKLAGYGSARQGSDIIWNFEKFVVDKHGQVVARIDPDIAPDDSRVTSVIESELAKN